MHQQARHSYVFSDHNSHEYINAIIMTCIKRTKKLVHIRPTMSCNNQQVYVKLTGICIHQFKNVSTIPNLYLNLTGICIFKFQSQNELVTHESNQSPPKMEHKKPPCCKTCWCNLLQVWMQSTKMQDLTKLIWKQIINSTIKNHIHINYMKVTRFIAAA